MQHEAAVLNAKGAGLVLISRPTPSPGLDEVVVAVKFIALNPVDHIQQSMGFKISKYPYILGFDASGIIHAVGSSASAKGLAVGDRVVVMASSWFSQNMDQGAFQQYVTVPTMSTPCPSTRPACSLWPCTRPGTLCW